jgi:endo-1,3(4)-beta-glucanase
MGPRQTRALTFATAGNTKDSRSWHDFRKNIMTSLSNTPPVVVSEIPPDNIFVPIQRDDILPQIPIGDHHPVPRTGIEDDNLRTLHTNKFYANTFLGAQNQPITTHPYTIWWGKGAEEQGLLQTWGMNISHVEEGDLVYGPGNPAKVGPKPYRYPVTDETVIHQSTQAVAHSFSSRARHTDTLEDRHASPILRQYQPDATLES